MLMKMVYQSLKSLLNKWNARSQEATGTILMTRRNHPQQAVETAEMNEEEVLRKYSTPGLRKNRLDDKEDIPTP